MENGGAESAGLKEGDVILSIDGKPTKTLSSLMGVIAQYSPGNEVNVTVNRDNDIQNYKVVLKNENGTTSIVRAGDSFYNDMLAAELQQIDQGDKEKLNLSGGVKVVRIENGILRQGGINEGFILTEINGVRVNSQQNLEDALTKSRSNIIRLKGVYPNGVKISYEFMK